MKRGGLLRCLRPGRPRAGLVAAIAASLVVGVRLPRAVAQTNSANQLETRLELELPLGCGTLVKFVERLRSRSGRIRFSDQGAERTVQARIAAETDGTFRATMTLSYSDGHSSSRIIEARSCNEAIDALALVTAVALDPLSVGNADGLPATTAPTRPERTIGKVPPPVPVERTPDQNGKFVAPPNAYTRLGVGVSFSSFRGPAPGWLLGFEPSLRLMSTRRSAFSPSARLGFSYTENRGNSSAGGIADFALASLVLDLCPWQVLGQTLEARSCALAHGGLVFAEGRATTSPESHLRQYWALGASAEVELMLSRGLGIPLRASASIPLVRDSYAFNPLSFYRVTGLNFGITAGLEIRFR